MNELRDGFANLHDLAVRHSRRILLLHKGLPAAPVELIRDNGFEVGIKLEQEVGGGGRFWGRVFYEDITNVPSSVKNKSCFGNVKPIFLHSCSSHQK